MPAENWMPSMNFAIKKRPQSNYNSVPNADDWRKQSLCKQNPLDPKTVFVEVLINNQPVILTINKSDCREDKLLNINAIIHKSFSSSAFISHKVKGKFTTDKRFKSIEEFGVLKNSVFDRRAFQNDQLKGYHENISRDLGITKYSIDNEVTTFKPSADLAKLLLKIVNKNYTRLADQADAYKESISEEDQKELDLLLEGAPDYFKSYSIDSASQQIHETVRGLLATIARTQSILGENAYKIAENDHFDDDVHDAFVDGFHLRPRDAYLFMPELYEEIKNSSIRNNIGGKWGVLEYINGEILMHITLKNNIEKREWTKAKVISL